MSRGWMRNPVFSRRDAFDERSAWCWIIEEAKWRPERARVGSAVMELQRGQLSHAHSFIGLAWGWHSKRVERFLKRLAKQGMVELETDAGTTVITVCEYDEYQLQPRNSDAGSTQRRRRGDADSKEVRKKESDADAPAREVVADDRGTSTPATRTGTCFGLPPRAEPQAGVAPPAVDAADPDTLHIVEAFEASLESVFGTGAIRPFRNAMDALTARRWLAASDARALARPDMLAVCQAVFDTTHRRMAGRNQAPPNVLAFHTRGVQDAVEVQLAPLPVGRTGDIGRTSRANQPRSNRWEQIPAWARQANGLLPDDEEQAPTGPIIDVSAEDLR